MSEKWTHHEWGDEWRGPDGWKIVRYADSGSLAIFTPYDDAEISIDDDGLYVFRGSTTGWTPKPSAVLIPLAVLRVIVQLMEAAAAATPVVTSVPADVVLRLARKAGPVCGCGRPLVPVLRDGQQVGVTHESAEDAEHHDTFWGGTVMERGDTRHPESLTERVARVMREAEAAVPPVDTRRTR